jgi:hypothetical protein
MGTPVGISPMRAALAPRLVRETCGTTTSDGTQDPSDDHQEQIQTPIVAWCATTETEVGEIWLRRHGKESISSSLILQSGCRGRRWTPAI